MLAVFEMVADAPFAIPPEVPEQLLIQFTVWVRQVPVFGAQSPPLAVSTPLLQTTGVKPLKPAVLLEIMVCVPCATVPLELPEQ